MQVANLFFFFFLFNTVSSFAETPKFVPKNPLTLTFLIQLGLENSLDRTAAKAETSFQQASEKVIGKNRYIPQISLSARYANFTYKNAFFDNAGNPISNDGHEPTFDLIVSYDLQKLFGPELFLANQATNFAKLQEKIATRNIIRNIKKSYYSIVEIQREIEELNNLIGLFARIEGVLLKQKNLGIYNEVERRQFQIQKSIQYSELETKKSELMAAFFQLSALINVDVETTKDLVSRIPSNAKITYAKNSNLNPDQISNIADKAMFENLSQDFNLADLEYRKYNSISLPSIYVKGTHTAPTMPSAEGPQTIAEIGITFPIDGFFTRPAQKTQLESKSDKTKALFQKAIFDYRNQIKMNATNLSRFQNLTPALNQAREETKKFLDKSFLFYSQKRIDVLGTLDIFSKYLQAVRNSLLNELQIELAESEIEYLVGGSSL